jgi:hypothetical protein
MGERARDDARPVDLTESDGEPTCRADVLFDRTVVRPRLIVRLTGPVGTSLLAIVIGGMIVQRVLRRP